MFGHLVELVVIDLSSLILHNYIDHLSHSPLANNIVLMLLCSS